MGNTYSGGAEYYDNEKTKHYIRKLLKSGGMLKEDDDDPNQLVPVQEGPNYHIFKKNEEKLNVNKRNDSRKKIAMFITNEHDAIENKITSAIDRSIFEITGSPGGGNIEGNNVEPSFITFTDLENITFPSSYTIIYKESKNIDSKRRTNIYYVSDSGVDKILASQFSNEVVYDISIINDLCLYLKETKQPPFSLTLHNVGEYIYQKRNEKKVVVPPNINTPNYDDSYLFHIASDDVHIQTVLSKGAPYEKYNMACLSVFITEGSTVLDIGANVGTVCIPIARLHNSNVTVIACELFSETKKILDMYIDINGAHNVISILGAIFMTMVESTGSTSLGTNKIGCAPTSGIDNTYTARMITIDSMNLQNVSAMKVDVEGAEPLVFYGARETIRRCKPVILFEKNTMTLNEEVMKCLNIDVNVFSFNIIDFCRTIGYTRFYRMQQYDCMLVHPDSIRKVNTAMLTAGTGIAYSSWYDKPFTRVQRLYIDANIERVDHDNPRKIHTLYEAKVMSGYSKFYYISPGSKNIDSKIGDVMDFKTSFTSLSTNRNTATKQRYNNQEKQRPTNRAKQPKQWYR